MKVRVDGEEKEIRALWIDDPDSGKVIFLDQRYIPWKIEFFESKSYRDTIYAIREMVVRGAPSIGYAGACAVYQALLELKGAKGIEKAAEEIKGARPTAVNLRNRVDEVVDFILRKAREGATFSEIKEATYKKVEAIAKEEIEANKRIGELGAELLKDGDRVLTHCNAGAPAAVDIGTALSPIRFAHKMGKRITVYATETRPWLQGARITAWELVMEDIPVYLISDNAAGYLMWKGEITAVIVGADRIVLNGDFANKIGTYKLAVVAKENGIPFYVAATLSTFDTKITNGKEIVVEERDPDEVRYVRGMTESGEIGRVLITYPEVRVKNPVFDITPFKYVTAIITEAGILRTEDDIKNALRKAGRL